MEYPKFYVKWLDSGFSLQHDIWQTYDEIKEIVDYPKEVETVGFLVYENEDWICLIQSVNKNPSSNLFRGGYLILKRNIVEKKEL